jgi:hypothetical protein
MVAELPVRNKSVQQESNNKVNRDEADGDDPSTPGAASQRLARCKLYLTLRRYPQ